MENLLEYLFLFCFCATAGWCLEFVYRGFRHHKVVNPGFLTGCCLPIYGMGGVILYFLSGLKLRFLPNEFLRITAILLGAMLIMTLIELVGGLIAVKYFHVQLWDYSGEWGNFMGVICPKFSVIWGLICALYYFLFYPLLHSVAERVIEIPWLILVVGMYAGIFVVDFCHSMRVMQRLRNYAAQMRTRINLDQLKASAKEHFRRESGRRRPFNFYSMINRYMLDMHGYRDQINHRWGNRHGKKGS
ncbi:MAG: putative ABC transporter permease [Clostridia bacterium]|nr:putative ABC transporter permease [Clostridia bacterium]